MLVKSLTLRNILSFGSMPHTIDLGPLNVIIGPNGSGKSNFIEAIALLQAAPRDIQEPIRTGGGVSEWLWKEREPQAAASIEIILTDTIDNDELSYNIQFSELAQRFHIVSEIFSLIPTENNTQRIAFFDIKNGRIKREPQEKRERNRYLDFDPEQSLLSQLSPPFNEMEVIELVNNFKSIQIIRELNTAKDAKARIPQRSDLPNMYLDDNASNIGLILNRLRRDIDTRKRIKNVLQRLYERVEDVDIQVEGGTVQIFLYEGRIAVPATRLSSGTLRFLCLLAILCHPKPPPLICLEEPELGLHPDLMPTIAELLKEASTRTQLVVTTHSEILVDALSDQPEAILVAEKGEAGTTLTRLDPERLKPWLEKYRLGQLWTSGEIGGTRW